jgi:hypothetical protein
MDNHYQMTQMLNKIPCSQNDIPHYTAYRVAQPLHIDGRLDKPAWAKAPRSTRFVDLVSGRRTLHDTRAAALWDDENLYVGFWVEEPCVEATLTERDSLVWTNNDVEVFIAGKNAYYEFEVNALNTIYEAFFVWDDAYERDGFSKLPEFARDVPGAQPWNGVGYTTHPRGMRMGYFKWDLPGVRSAVWVDGTLNDNTDRDRGWTVELALPWAGLKPLTLGDERVLPPHEGDAWQMSFSRFNTYKEAAPAQDSGGWTLSSHGVWDSHIPECFPMVHFSGQCVDHL